MIGQLVFILSIFALGFSIISLLYAFQKVEKKSKERGEKTKPEPVSFRFRPDLGTLSYLSGLVMLVIIFVSVFFYNVLILKIALSGLAFLMLSAIVSLFIEVYPERGGKGEFMRNLEEWFEEFRRDMDPRLEDFNFTLRKIKENPISLAGLGIILGFAVIALFAPVIAPPPEDSDDPYMIPHEGFKATPEPPDDEHPFGTTKYQYDIFYGVIWGSRTAFRIGILVVGGMLLLGTLLGSLAGYYGGIVDESIMRLVDIIIAVPAIVLAIVVVTIFGKNLDIVMGALIFAYWPYYARLIRSEILSVREEEYVEAAEAVGGSDSRIITKHILPNSTQSVLVMATLDMGTMLILAAALSFLGLGAPTGYADWGGLLSFSRDFISEPQFWYTHVFPGIAIFLYVFGWILLSDAFRDITDPWLRRR